MALGRTARHYRSNPASRQKHRDYMAGYNKTPQQKAYRRALARARRKRGIMGKGGGDLSHSKNGSLTRKSMKINRAANGHGNNSRYA
jgi:hypothetical protein